LWDLFEVLNLHLWDCLVELMKQFMTCS
jgi:hypothetical protein